MKKFRNFLLLVVPICLVLLLGVAFTHKIDQVAYAATGNGGAVYIASGTTYTMSGGTITGKKATYGGAIYIANGGTFNLNGGTIKNNTAIYGSAIYIANGGKFNYKAGTISGSIYLSGGSYINITGMPSSTLEISKLSYNNGDVVAKVASGISASSVLNYIKASNLPDWFSLVVNGSNIEVYGVRTAITIHTQMELEIINMKDPQSSYIMGGYGDGIGAESEYELVLENDFNPGKYKLALGASYTICIFDENDEIVYRIIPVVSEYAGSAGLDFDGRQSYHYIFRQWILNETPFEGDILSDANESSRWQYIEIEENDLFCDCSIETTEFAQDNNFVEFDLRLGYLDMYNREGLESCNFVYDETYADLFYGDTPIQNCSHFKIPMSEISFDNIRLIGNRVVFGTNLDEIAEGRPENAYISLIVTLYDDPYIRGPRGGGEPQYNIAFNITDINGYTLYVGLPQSDYLSNDEIGYYAQGLGYIKIQLYAIPQEIANNMQDLPDDNYINELFGDRDYDDESLYERDYIVIGTQNAGLNETESIIATWYYYSFVYGRNGYEYFQTKVNNYLKNQYLQYDLVSEYDELVNKGKIIIENLSTEITDYMFDPGVFGSQEEGIVTLPRYDFIIPNFSEFWATGQNWLNYYEQRTGREMTQNAYDDLLRYLRQGAYNPNVPSIEDQENSDVYIVTPLKLKDGNDKLSLYQFLYNAAARSDDGVIDICYDTYLLESDDPLYIKIHDLAYIFYDAATTRFNLSANLYQENGDTLDNKIQDSYFGWYRGPIYIVGEDRLEHFVTLFNEQSFVTELNIYSFSNLFDITSFVPWSDGEYSYSFENALNDMFNYDTHYSTEYGEISLSEIEEMFFNRECYIIASNYSVGGNFGSESRASLISGMLIQLRLKDNYDYYLYGRRNSITNKLNFADYNYADKLHLYL